MCLSPPRLYYATSEVMQSQVHLSQAKTIQKLSITDKKGYSAVEALALIIDNNLFKHYYKNLRNGALKLGFNLYSLYNSVRQCKTIAFQLKTERPLLPKTGMGYAPYLR